MATVVPAPATSGGGAPVQFDAWGEQWELHADLEGAETVFETIDGLCATTASGVRCLKETPLGPLAKAHVRSPVAAWGYIFLCAVQGASTYVCSHPSSDSPSQGPAKLQDVTSLTVHAATHGDGSLSVTTGEEYHEPGWAKVRAVSDAVQVASSWHATHSCYLRKNGEVACVDHAVDAIPVRLGKVTDASRVWQTDQATWVLTKGGRLFVAKDWRGAVTEVAKNVAHFAPTAAPPGAKAAADDAMPSEVAEVPCAVTTEGRLSCGLARDWNLTAVRDAGRVAQVFGGYDWICTIDPARKVRCRRP